MKCYKCWNSYSYRYPVSYIYIVRYLEITSAGVLTFVSPADYEAQSDSPAGLPYDGSTYDITAT